MTAEKTCPFAVKAVPVPAAVAAFDAMGISALMTWAEECPAETALFLRALAESGDAERPVAALSIPGVLDSLLRKHPAADDVLKALRALGDDDLARVMTTDGAWGTGIATCGQVLAELVPAETADLLIGMKNEGLRLAVLRNGGDMAWALVDALGDPQIKKLVSSFEREELRAGLLMLPAVASQMKEEHFIDAVKGIEDADRRAAIFSVKNCAWNLADAGWGFAVLEMVQEASSDLRAEVLASGLVPRMLQVSECDDKSFLMKEIARLETEGQKVKVLSAPGGVVEALVAAGHASELGEMLNSFREPRSAPAVFATRGAAEALARAGQASLLSKFAQQFASAVMENAPAEAPGAAATGKKKPSRKRSAPGARS